MAAPSGMRVCDSSGLAIVDQPSLAWRAFKTRYGPLNPKLKLDSESEGRFDCADCVTVYAASDRRGAIEEVLAYLQPADIRYDRIFPDVEPDDDPVADEWKQGGISPSRLDIVDWASKWGIAKIVPASGSYVMISVADTIGALRRNADEWMPEGADDFDVSALTGASRQITCAASNWVSRRVLDDGAEPAGLNYVSKHGTDHECWAIWIPLLGVDSQSEVPALVEARIELKEQSLLEQDDVDLGWAVDALGWPAA